MAGENEKVAELEGQVTDMEAQIADLTKQLAKAAPAEGDTGGDPAVAEAMSAQLDEATTSLEAAAEAIDSLTKDRDLALSMAKLTAKEKAAADAEDAKDQGADEDVEDASGNKITNTTGKKKLALVGKRLAKFLSMSSEDRAKYMADIEKKDETVTLDGQTIHKSAVGEATFTILKSQSERIAKNEKDLAIEKANREKLELEKRADEKYSHVPGSLEERGKMLGAIAKMDEATQKLFDKVFEQSEKMVAAGFAKLGSGGGRDPKDLAKDEGIAKATLDFNTKVAEIKKRDDCTRTAALAKARKENPELFKIYQDSEPEETAAAN
jgi:hypothetical protein